MNDVHAIDNQLGVISIHHLWADYKHEPVLEDIYLSVKALDFIGLIGSSGSGKMTFFKVLLGLLPPMQGDVRIMGMNVRKGRRYIGYVPQFVEFDHAFPISVWEVVLLGRLGKRRLFQRHTAQDHACVAAALREVEIFDLRHRPISELSGGQRKRVYIARALATEPQILLLDEPLAGVDPHAGTHIYDLLKQLNEHLTILLISHDSANSWRIGQYCLRHHWYLCGRLHWGWASYSVGRNSALIRSLALCGRLAWPSELF